ncbi:Membrane-bound lytic murein transglycosylase B precursor (EC [uncultured Gammaproteobacteria bacterium]|nr:Membrane-bound lytic murein transglycosylase B precursor (EC [uncultured Gammaproteobacteria bacterium]
MLRSIFLFIFTISAGLSHLSLAETDDTLRTDIAQNFEAFLADIRIKAIKQGISETTLERAFDGLTLNPKVIQYDRNQAEFTLNFWRYMNSRVSNNRLEKGKAKLKEIRPLLVHIYKKYGVQPSILVAFWGLETNYGKHVGKMALVRSLATLSFDLRRREFFTKELLILFKLIDQEKLPHNAQGSWAGAMGDTQFMPSNVAAYGVDADKNGKLDLWDSEEDIFYSSANFLKRIGWHRGELWGREVTVPEDFDFSLAGLKIKKSIKEWVSLGVKHADDKKKCSPIA